MPSPIDDDKKKYSGTMKSAINNKTSAGMGPGVEHSEQMERITKALMPQHCNLNDKEKNNMCKVITDFLHQSLCHGVPVDVLESIASLTHREYVNEESNMTEKEALDQNTMNSISIIKIFLNSSPSKEAKISLLRLLIYVLDKSATDDNWDEDHFQRFFNDNDDDVDEDHIDKIFLTINESFIQKSCIRDEEIEFSNNSISKHDSFRTIAMQTDDNGSSPAAIKIEGISPQRTEQLAGDMAKVRQEKCDISLKPSDESNPHSDKDQPTSDRCAVKNLESSKTLLLTQTSPEGQLPKKGDVARPKRFSEKNSAEILSDMKRVLVENQNENSSGNDPEWTDQIVERPVVFLGDTASDFISSGARWVEKSLALSVVPAVNSGIERTGSFVKKNIEPGDGKQSIDRQAEVTALVYSHKIKETTDKVRETAHTVRYGIRNASTRGINKIAKKVDEKDLGTQLCPDEGVRDLVVATGKIGLATLGGVAVVAEAIYHTTRDVAQKSTKVTADVVRYKYGDTAGTLVQETGDSLGNVVRTLTHITAVEGKVMAEAIAKNTGKVAIKGDRENTNSCERPNADERTGSEKHSMSSPQAGVIDNKAKHLKEIDGKACSSCSHD